jgi:N-acetylmuramoyl-L-alanine amidase
MITEHRSPNFDDRKGRQPDLLLLHYTGMVSGAAALQRLCDPAAEVSSHYLIEEDGRVYALVDEEQRAWHAGRSRWAGEEGLNACSLGIEIVNPGHEFGYRPFPEAQVAAVVALCRDILARWSIPPWRVLGHSDVAPLRKADPGELFPWPRLAAAGIGLWPPALAPAEGELSEVLADFGYGYLEDDAAAVTRAFQRHFRPARIDGLPDGECLAIARWLTAAVDRSAQRP